MVQFRLNSKQQITMSKRTAFKALIQFMQCSSNNSAENTQQLKLTQGNWIHATADIPLKAHDCFGLGE